MKASALPRFTYFSYIFSLNHFSEMSFFSFMLLLFSLSLEVHSVIQVKNKTDRNHPKHKALCT